MLSSNLYNISKVNNTYMEYYFSCNFILISHACQITYLKIIKMSFTWPCETRYLKVRN